MRNDFPGQFNFRVSALRGRVITPNICCFSAGMKPAITGNDSAFMLVFAACLELVITTFEIEIESFISANYFCFLFGCHWRRILPVKEGEYRLPVFRVNTPKADFQEIFSCADFLRNLLDRSEQPHHLKGFSDKPGFYLLALCVRIGEVRAQGYVVSAPFPPFNC